MMKKTFKILFSLLLALALCSCPVIPDPVPAGPGPESPGEGTGLILSDSITRHIVSTVTVENSGAALSALSVLLPIPQSNIYQSISNLDLNGAAEKSISGTRNKCAQFYTTSGLPGPGGQISFSIEYDVVLSKILVDTDSITSYPAYQTQTPLYQAYTSKHGSAADGWFVDTDNADIRTTGDLLWQGCSGNIIAYAHDCYEYIAKNFSYKNPNTGLHTVSSILTSEGGDCGNLSSLFVSLMRYKGIPARHLVTIRPDGSAHVWADFYIEGTGWIPVDVTYAQSDYEANNVILGDYFGDVAVNSNGIIMTTDVYYNIQTGKSDYTISMLQSYAWFYWYTSPGSVTASYSMAQSAP